MRSGQDPGGEHSHTLARIESAGTWGTGEGDGRGLRPTWGKGRGCQEGGDEQGKRVGAETP